MAQVTDADLIRRKITHLLDIYPGISPTMLQAAMGPQVQPRYWRPILNELMSQHVVKQEHVAATTPTGRFNHYTKLFLNGHDNNAS